MTQPSPFRYFKTSPEIIRLAVMLYIRFPLSLRKIEDLLHECGIEISHETVLTGGTGSARCSLPRSGASVSKPRKLPPLPYTSLHKCDAGGEVFKVGQQ